MWNLPIFTGFSDCLNYVQVCKYTIMSSSLPLPFSSSPFLGKNSHSLMSVMFISTEMEQRAMVRGCVFDFLLDQMLVISKFIIKIKSLNFHSHLSKDETNSKSNQIM